MNIKCQCHEHEHDNDIVMICQNQFCKECRLLCADCITEQIHTHTTTDLQKFLQCIKVKFKQTQIVSRNFTLKLRDCVKKINEILRDFEQQINDNFIMSIDEIYKMKCIELSDFINHMDKFVSTSDDKIKELEQFIGDISQKIKECQKELDLQQLIYKNSSSNFNYKIGMDYYEQQNWKEAICSFDFSLQQNPKNLDSLCQKGFCLANLNQFEESNEIFEVILEKQNHHSLSIFGQGYCLQKQEQFEQSIIYFDKALSIDHKNIDVLLSKGESLRILKKYQEAIQVFEKIIELDPNNVEAMTAKGKSLRLLNEYQESITWYDKSLEINSNHFQTLLLKGQSLKLLGRIEESEYFVNLAMSISK